MSRHFFAYQIGLLSMALFTVVQASEVNDPDLSDIDKPFPCIHEKDRFPPIAPKVDSLYRYADYLGKHTINENEQDLPVLQMMERLYRIGAAHDDYRANQALRKMLLEDKAHSENPVDETINLTIALLNKKLASGYFDMATYINYGIGGRPRKALALQYYRKYTHKDGQPLQDELRGEGIEPALDYYMISAALGSAEAQVYLINLILFKLDDQDILEDKFPTTLLHCAAEQGNKEALYQYAKMQQKKNPTEALLYYQKAIKNGDNGSASYLGYAIFSNTLPPNDPDYLGVTADPERASRYKIIADTLNQYKSQQPTVPELDEIVPLPPAPLPPWDGKIQWERERKTTTPPPPKPSQAKPSQAKPSQAKMY